MNNFKTGALIADLRRQQNWTQSDLAQKLGVTDKAVSRWETGRGLPDISLLKPLSEILGVTVNELIIGERINPEAQTASADETILKTLLHSNQRVNRLINGLLFAFGGILLVIAVLFLGYDTSWVSIYSVLGMLFVATGVFRLFKKRLLTGLLAAGLTLLLAFGLFEARDYISVTHHAMPPLYTISITTTFPNGEKTIRYHKLFYDVYRYHVDSEDEFYRIVRP